MRDRRFEPRRPTNETVQLRWVDTETGDQTCSGAMHDLSRSGARIHLDRPIRVHTALHITIRGNELQGRAMYTVRNEEAYILGVEFDSEFQGPLKPQP